MNARLAALILALAGTALATPHQTDRTVTSRAHSQPVHQQSQELAQMHESQQRAGETTAAPSTEIDTSLPGMQLEPLPSSVFARPALDGPRTSFPGSP